MEELSVAEGGAELLVLPVVPWSEDVGDGADEDTLGEAAVWDREDCADVEELAAAPLGCGVPEETEELPFASPVAGAEVDATEGDGVEEADSGFVVGVTSVEGVLVGAALTSTKECDIRTTREKSVRMCTADAEQ